MVLCGVAGGIGSIFKAPFGGAVFAVEVLYGRDFEVEALIPCFISSVVAYSVFSSFFGFQHVFDAPNYSFRDPLTLPLYGLLGVVCALVGRFYVGVFRWTRKMFNALAISKPFKPALGGALLGAIAFFVPEVLETSYGWLQMAIYEGLPIVSMLVISVAKIFATSFTIGSGGSGGVFAPSLVIGGMIGGVFGKVAKLIFPFIDFDPGSFVLVGMAAFFAGVAKVPMASIIMVSEMTGDYGLLVPLMFSCVTSYILTGKHTIYESQVPTRAESPAHRDEFLVEVLRDMRVKDVMTGEVVTVNPEDPVTKVLELVRLTGHLGYPVLKDGKLIGLVTYRDALRALFTGMERAKVKDVMSRKLVVITPEDTLDTALHLSLIHI